METIKMGEQDGYRVVGKAADVPEGYVMPYYLDDLKHRIAVARIGGRLYAFDDLSPTDRSPLSSGRLTGTEIMSPCDAARFDVATGAPRGGPARTPLPTYSVREVTGEVEVMLRAATS